MRTQEDDQVLVLKMIDYIKVSLSSIVSEFGNHHEQGLENSFASFKLLLVFLALTLIVNLDELCHPATLGLSSTKVATVPLFNAWTIGWNANRLTHGFGGYWDAPIFYPVQNTFAFSEPQPATLLVAPFVYATGSVIVGYKAYLFLSLFLNGFFAALLLSRFGYHWSLQILGGMSIMLLPIVHQRIDVIQLVPVWGILWFWSSLFELMKQPSFKRSVWLGISYAVCFTLCIHHSLFLTLLVPFSCLVFLPKLLDWRLSLLTLNSILIGVVLVLPLILPIHQAAQEHNFERKDKLVSQLSAHSEDYLNSPANSLIKFAAFDDSKSRQFCVGWFRMLLAAIGLIVGLCFKQRRRWVLFLVLTGVSAFFLSLGPNFHIGEWNPWQSTIRHLPGVSQVRSVYRFVWFVQLAVMFLAIEGIESLLMLYKNHSTSQMKRIAFGLLVLMSGLLFVGEVWPERTLRAGIPQVANQKDWIAYLRENRPQGEAIACLPFATGKTVHDYDVTTRWMCYGLEHQIPMVNGYSGFFPEEYLETKKLFDINGPSVEGIKRLSEIGIYLIVVSRRYCAPHEMSLLKSPLYELDLVFSDPTVGIDIYRLNSKQ